MKISVVILTFNRADLVHKALSHSLGNAGHPIDELIWVDNGSTDRTTEIMQAFSPDVAVRHNINLGVAKGMNHGMVLSSGDWIAIFGCDMLMPDGWLATYIRYITEIPETDVAAMYCHPIEEVSERLAGKLQTRNGLQYIPAMPMGGGVMIRKETVVKNIGYLREDFGLYGWDDVEWAQRCLARGAFCYVIPGQVPIHLGTEGVKAYDGKDLEVYHAFKRQQADDPNKIALLKQCQKEGFPYYNPYS